MGLLRKIISYYFHRRDESKLRAELDIGAGTRVSLSNLESNFPHLIRIGKNCLFAPTAMVLVHDASYYLFTEKVRVAPVTIGDNVFVGYGAIIMPGVTIGSNVVIGAGSVVNKDVPSDCVVAGVPSRVICTVSEYLAKCKRDQMFTPPYAGKPPEQFTQEDILAFRAVLYRAMRERKDG